MGKPKRILKTAEDKATFAELRKPVREYPIRQYREHVQSGLSKLTGLNGSDIGAIMNEYQGDIVRGFHNETPYSIMVSAIFNKVERARIKERDYKFSERNGILDYASGYIHDALNEAVKTGDRDMARKAYKASHALYDVFPDWAETDNSGAGDDFIRPFEKLTGYVYGNKPR